LNAIEDYKGKRTSLKTLRTKEKKEVDFVLVVENEPVSMLEIKLSDSQISSTLRYFHKRYGIPAIQLVKNLRLEQVIEGIELRKASRYLRDLVM
jgi:hypothetical protein